MSLPLMVSPSRPEIPIKAIASEECTNGDALAPCRVLIVDDTRASAFVLGKLLETMGQEVDTANDGTSAIAKACAIRPDAIVSDIAMPDMDGYELARRLRQEPSLEGVVLAALTGYGQESDRQQALEAGFDYHLVKPVSLEALEELLANIRRAAIGRERIPVE